MATRSVPTKPIATSDSEFHLSASAPKMASLSGGTASGVMTLYGDGSNDSVVVSRSAYGGIYINNDAFIPSGPPATVGNTSAIQAYLQGGDDTFVMNEANGALPKAYVYAGAGNDTVTTGSGDDMIFGGTGNDVLQGKGGTDIIYGGGDNDTLIGGDGNDKLFGEDGDDRMIWNAGDDSDLMEGGSGVDTVEVNGSNSGETFIASANGSRVLFERADNSHSVLDIGTTEKLSVNMNGGDDVFDAVGNLASYISVTVDGGSGNDTIRGSNGADVLFGGEGNDVITGRQGDDMVLLGAGDDVALWSAGDGNDFIDGQAGDDTLKVFGADNSEKFDVSSVGAHVKFTRDTANVSLDIAGVEDLYVAARGGADNVTIHQLGGTDVKSVAVDLGSSDDLAADTVTVEGTANGDVVTLFGNGTSRVVTGLPESVAIIGGRIDDTVKISVGNGNDTVNASGVFAGDAQLVVDGGSGNDSIIGGYGDDVIIGGRGDDTVQMGAGSDRFVWSSGDGSDVVDGQTGFDLIDMTMANYADQIDVGAIGDHLNVQRVADGGSINAVGVEQVQLHTRLGSDSVTIHSLSGTGVAEVDVDLSTGYGAADSTYDLVTVEGTDGDDTISLVMQGDNLIINGLSSRIVISHFDASDEIFIKGLGGRDVIDASGIGIGGPVIHIEGGAGNDYIVGSVGGDLLFGGEGDDVIHGGWGGDFIDGGAGNDVLFGDGGGDLLVNGEYAVQF